MTPALRAAFAALLGASLLMSPSKTQALPSSAEVEQRADSILKKMTLEEKIDYIGGVNFFYIRPIERLGVPAFRMADGPIGVRNYGPATAYAAGICMAAAFDEDLAAKVGEGIGKDARARGVHYMLCPGVNIYRAPMCGRNFEYFGEDPFLAARMAVPYIEGIQSQRVAATVKHFACNNSELDRHHTSSDVDPRTLREIYFPAFEAAVKEAHVASIMNSYNLLNGEHATQSDFLNNQVAKKEWGFDGVIMSDWHSVYDGLAVAKAGMDLEMPAGEYMNRETLLPAIKDGRLKESVIDDKVRRILRVALRFGWMDRPQTDLSWPLYSPAGRQTALRGAREGMVLLKNEGLLPLAKKKIKTLAVIGPDAFPAVPVAGGSGKVAPFEAVSYLQGIARLLEGQAVVYYKRGVVSLAEVYAGTDFSTEAKGGRLGLEGEYFTTPNLSGSPAVVKVDERMILNWDRPNAWPAGNAKTFSGRWSGFYTPSSDATYRWVATTYGLDDFKLFIDGNLVLERAGTASPIGIKDMALKAGQAYAVRFEYLHSDHHAWLNLGVRRADQFVDPEAAAVARQADAAVILAGFDYSNETEGSDRTFELPLGQDQLIQEVLAANKKSVVVLTSGGGVEMGAWLDKAPALLQAWYAGEEAGTALAEILFGQISPSGKLPISWERRWEDNPAHDFYYPDAQNHIRYGEGVFVGYRYYDQAKAKPLFPFGFGLSYTKFKYSGLKLSSKTLKGEGSLEVTFEIKNSGRMQGAESAQVYVAPPPSSVPRPVKELKGFARADLKPGKSRKLSVKLDRRAFSFYDVKSGQWKAEPGEYQILVGSSSQKIELKGKVRLD